MLKFLKNRLKKNKILYNLYNLSRNFFNKLYFLLFGSQKSKWNFHFIGSYKMLKGRFEVDETNYFRDKIKDFDLFINIGANIGYYVCHAAESNIDTISFEPLSSNLLYLNQNISQFNSSQHLVYPLALSDKRGLSMIYGKNMMASLISNWNNGKENTFVSLMHFDDFYKIHYNNLKIFILIDAEGSEYKLLKKSIEFLNNRIKPTWFIEIQNYEHQPNNEFNKHFNKTFEIFSSAGYKVSYLEGSKLINIDYDKIKALILKNQNIKNFLFN